MLLSLFSEYGTGHDRLVKVVDQSKLSEVARTLGINVTAELIVIFSTLDLSTSAIIMIRIFLMYIVVL